MQIGNDAVARPIRYSGHIFLCTSGHLSGESGAARVFRAVLDGKCESPLSQVLRVIRTSTWIFLELIVFFTFLLLFVSQGSEKHHVTENKSNEICQECMHTI